MIEHDLLRSFKVTCKAPAAQDLSVLYHIVCMKQSMRISFSPRDFSFVQGYSLTVMFVLHFVLFKEDRLQNWFNSPGHDTVCEHPETAMEAYDDGDEASATGVVEARFENVLHYKVSFLKNALHDPNNLYLLYFYVSGNLVLFALQ